MALGNTVVGSITGGSMIGGTVFGGTVGVAAAAALVAPASTASTRTARPARRPDTGQQPDGASAGEAPVPPTRCRCGHEAAAHEHFRPGTDCGACGAKQCGRFRPSAGRRGWLRALGRVVRRGA